MTAQDISGTKYNRCREGDQPYSALQRRLTLLPFTAHMLLPVSKSHPNLDPYSLFRSSPLAHKKINANPANRPITATTVSTDDCRFCVPSNPAVTPIAIPKLSFLINIYSTNSATHRATRLFRAR